MKTLADRLKETREALKWTKAYLRRRAGIKSASTLTELENGTIKDSPQLPLIAAALGVEVLWLQHGKGPKKRGGSATSADEESAGNVMPFPSRKITQLVKIARTISEDGLLLLIGRASEIAVTHPREVGESNAAL